MQKDTFIGVVVLAIVVLGVFTYGILRPTPAKAPVTPTTLLSLPDLHYSDKTPEYDIEANYASSTPLREPANAAAVALMKSFVADTITQFKDDVSADGNTDQTASSTLDIVYLMGSSEHTRSYIFTISEYLNGTAHGNESFTTFTFDTTTGARLTLADLFLPGTDYLGTLSGLARARLPGVIGDRYDINAIKDGTTPTEDHFKNFFFDSTDFVVLFHPYQVAAYSEGPQTLRIPTSLLSSILKLEYRY